MLSIRSARDLAMSGVTWDTITRAVAKVVSSSSIMVRPCRVSVVAGRYSVISLQTATHPLEKSEKIAAQK